VIGGEAQLPDDDDKVEVGIAVPETSSLRKSARAQQQHLSSKSDAGIAPTPASELQRERLRVRNQAAVHRSRQTAVLTVPPAPHASDDSLWFGQRIDAADPPQDFPQAAACRGHEQSCDVAMSAFWEMSGLGRLPLSTAPVPTADLEAARLAADAVLVAEYNAAMDPFAARSGCAVCGLWVSGVDRLVLPVSAPQFQQLAVDEQLLKKVREMPSQYQCAYNMFQSLDGSVGPLHLYPASVDSSTNMMCVCAACNTALVGTTKLKARVPQLCLASGFDFGHVPPSFAALTSVEAMLLSFGYAHEVLVKVTATAAVSSQQQARFKLKGHTIMFSRDAPKQVLPNLSSSFSAAEFCERFAVMFVGTKAQYSKLLAQRERTTDAGLQNPGNSLRRVLERYIDVRPAVLRQYFDFYCHVNVQFAGIVCDPSFRWLSDEELVAIPTLLLSQVEVVSDPKTVRLDRMASASVASARADPREDISASMPPIGYADSDVVISTIVTDDLIMRATDVDLDVPVGAAGFSHEHTVDLNESLADDGFEPVELSELVESFTMDASVALPPVHELSPDSVLLRATLEMLKASGAHRDATGVAARSEPATAAGFTVATDAACTVDDSTAVPRGTFVEVVTDAEPLSEFSGNGTNIMRLFPSLFVLGGGCPFEGTLKPAFTQYLLTLADRRFATCHKLLFLLYDQSIRHDTCAQVAAKVKDDPAAVSSFVDIINSPDFKSRLEAAVKNPTAPDARALLAVIEPLVRVTSAKIQYSAGAREMVLSNIAAMNHFFGLPSWYDKVSLFTAVAAAQYHARQLFMCTIIHDDDMLMHSAFNCYCALVAGW
jgi:hypothetical protein